MFNYLHGFSCLAMKVIIFVQDTCLLVHRYTYSLVLFI
uniref:Uncharacterized protein n=1 Tax=Arundo donax TaxID=35708 RepID=A0A0A8ZH72_ARUDO